MTETTPIHDPGQALSGRQLARTTGLIMIALLMSGVLGLVRQVVISGAFGAGIQLDAFYAALRVPETLFTLAAGGALGSAFIPVFAEFLTKDDFEGAWRLAGTVFSFVLLVTAVLSILAFILADPLVRVILQRGAPEEGQALAVELMRIMLATTVIFSVSGLMMGILNGYQHFLAPAFAPTMYNVGIIIGAVFLVPSLGIHGLAWGVLLGALLHLLIQLPFLRGLDYVQFLPGLNWHQPGVTSVLILMVPRTLGLGVVQVNFWVNTTLTSHMAAGSLAALSFAYALMFVVLGVLGQSVGTAVFPTLSRYHAEGDHAEFWRTLTRSLRSVLFLSIPAGLGLAVLAEPIVATLFQHGAWTATDTAGTAWALALFAVGLAGHTALEVLARAFYSLHDTWTPVKIGGMTMILNIVLSLILIRVLGYPDKTDFARGPFGGLALSMSIATVVESSILWILLRRRLEMTGDGGVFSTTLRTLIASLVMVGVVFAWGKAADDFSAPVVTVVGIGIGALTFGVAGLLFQIDEARTMRGMILARLRR